MSYTTPKHCIFCGDPTSLCRCPPEILEFARAHVVFTDDWRGIVSGDTLRVLIERAQEWGRIASSAARPEVVASVDPDSEAANPVWDLVIQTCAQAWPAGKLTWNNSPTELIVDIINARDDALDDVKRLHEEKMKFFERVIELEREIQATRSPLAKHEEKP